MIQYSIIIPTFGRPEFLKKCLDSILIQTIKPEAVFIIDNNIHSKTQDYVKEIVNKLPNEKFKFNYIKGLINSGAVARNHGASIASSELVAFLDDDVVLDNNYYENILRVFESNSDVVGVQGLDRSLVESYKLNRNNYLSRIFNIFENIFEHSFIIKKNSSNLRPSLAVTHPIPTSKFFIESQWISTCAGVFKRKIFDIIEFPKNFVKYSWNEYVFFSYSIYKKNLGKMIYTSSAKYRNVATDEGRLEIKELAYMAEVYDLYVFSNLFKNTFYNKYVYLKSRLGRLLFLTLKMIYKREFNLKYINNLLRAFILAYQNRIEIKKGNFDCYNNKFPI